MCPPTYMNILTELILLLNIFPEIRKHPFSICFFILPIQSTCLKPKVYITLHNLEGPLNSLQSLFLRLVRFSGLMLLLCLGREMAYLLRSCVLMFCNTTRKGLKKRWNGQVDPIQKIFNPFCHFYSRDPLFTCMSQVELLWKNELNIEFTNSRWQCLLLNIFQIQSLQFHNLSHLLSTFECLYVQRSLVYCSQFEIGDALIIVSYPDYITMELKWNKLGAVSLMKYSVIKAMVDGIR